MRRIIYCILALTTATVSAAAIHEAVRNGETETVKRLIENGADVNARDYQHETPLHIASGRGNTEIAQLLIDKGADVNAQDDKQATPLHVAAHNGNIEVAEILIKNDANVNARDYQHETPLHIAVRKGNLNNVNQIIRGNPQAIQTRDQYGNTPLHIAAHHGKVAIAALLIKNGANVNARGIQNATPLHRAAGQGRAKVAEILIMNRAHVNAQNNQNATPLHLAAEQGMVSAARLLIDKGAQINAQAHHNVTPLMVAIHHNNRDMVSLLIGAGANIHPNNTPQALFHDVNILFQQDQNLAVRFNQLQYFTLAQALRIQAMFGYNNSVLNYMKTNQVTDDQRASLLKDGIISNNMQLAHDILKDYTHRGPYVRDVPIPIISQLASYQIEKLIVGLIHNDTKLMVRYIIETMREISTNKQANNMITQSILTAVFNKLVASTQTQQRHMTMLYQLSHDDILLTRLSFAAYKRYKELKQKFRTLKRRQETIGTHDMQLSYR